MNILSIDQGTTSSRAIIFDELFNEKAKSAYPVKQIYPEPGYVEHDPLQILESQYHAISDVVKSCAEKIDCIGITNQRETVIVWNKKNGVPIFNAIVWQCRRTADICEKMVRDGYSDTVKNKTGLNVDAYFSGTKIKWILDNVEGARKMAKDGNLLCGTVDCWLIWKLTGKHVTDVTNASRTMLFNINSLQWDREICEYFDIPMKMLPEVVDNSGIIGYVKFDSDIPKEIHGVPVCSSIGDQQAALFGQCCYNIGSVKNTYGTGCFTLMNIGKSIILDKKLLTSIGWKIKDQLVYSLEGSVFNAGSSIQWLRDELGIISSAHECDILAESVNSSNGVVFVSAFTGLGAPHWDMYARGSLFGLTRGSGKAHICRAVLEGIAYQVYDLVSTMSTVSNIPIPILKVDGGASVSNFMMQFQSDIINCPIERPDYIESTSLGAAMMAKSALVGLDFDELTKNRRVERVFKPEISDQERASSILKWNKAIEASNIFKI